MRNLNINSVILDHICATTMPIKFRSKDGFIVITIYTMFLIALLARPAFVSDITLNANWDNPSPVSASCAPGPS